MPRIQIMPLYFDYVLNKKYPVIVLVGGRYSGKTHFVGQQTVMNLNNHSSYKVLVVEDVETNINEGVKTNVEERIEEFDLLSYYDITKAPPKIRHENGNSMIFKGYHSDKQQKQAKSLNDITAIWYEEAENITYEQFKSLRMLLRGGNPEDRQLFLTMNPVNPDGFINTFFFIKGEPDKVMLRFDDGRPKIFIKNIEIDIDGKKNILECLVVVSTHWDNPYLTDIQRADVEEYRISNPDLYKQLGEGRFIRPRGTLIKTLNNFSLSKLDVSQAGNIIAVVDTASSGSDSATLGIYAKYDEEHHYLIDAIKDDRNADVVIPRIIERIKKYNPSAVYVEKNHEGLYYESELKKGLPKSIMVYKFHSTENKHEKILSQSGRISQHLFVRDDAGREYEEFVTGILNYNKEPKLNKHDDCIDNAAMYFKHTQKSQWGWY